MKQKKDRKRPMESDGQLNGILTAGNSSMTAVLLWSLLMLPAWIGKNGAGVCMVNIGMFAGTTFAWLFLVKRLRAYRDVSKREMFHVWDYVQERYQSAVTTECYLTVWFVLTALLACAVIKDGSRTLGRLLGIGDTAAAVDVFVFLAVMQCVLRTKTRALVRTIAYSVLFLQFSALIVIVFLSDTPRGILDAYGSIHLAGGTSSYLNILYMNGEQVGAIQMISMIGMGCGCLGLPFLFEGALDARDVRELDRGRILSILYAGGIVVAASMWSLLNIACIYPAKIQTDDGTDELLELFMQTLIQKNGWPVGARYLVMWLYAFAVLFLAEQIVQMMFSVLHGMFRADKGIQTKRGRTVRFFGILAGGWMLLAGLVFPIDWNEQELIGTVWEYASAVAAPCIFMLACRIADRASALAGLFSGLTCCTLWRFVPLLDGGTLADATGLSAGTAAFIFGLAVSVIVGMFTHKSSEEEKRLFDRMKLEQR